MAAPGPLALGTEEHAAVVMPGVTDVHLEFEIAVLLIGGEMAHAIAVEHGAERLEPRLAFRDMPLGKIRRGLI